MTPFSLLEDTKQANKEKSYLFLEAAHEVKSTTANTFEQAMQKVEQLQAEGYYLVGHINYEACYIINKKISQRLKETDYPLLHFIAYKKRIAFKSKDHQKIIQQYLPQLKYQEGKVDFLQLNTHYKDYAEQFKQVMHYLEQGCSYQVNLTSQLNIKTDMDAYSFYHLLCQSQKVHYAAYLPFDDYQVLSISPELFFSKQDTQLTLKPMKGTAPRNHDPKQDQANKHFLENDEKNKAENLIIVDLLRNDVSRIAKTGTCKVKKLFSIEDYQTVYQMTSMITAECEKETCFSKIVHALFPCGSITGAPKLRTLTIINELETQQRNIYTGAIGYITPDNNMMFNVAIRTISRNNNKTSMGVGGGITVKSILDEEWNEIFLKSKFLRKHYRPRFKLIESIKCQNTYHALSLHLTRLQHAASELGFECPIDAIKQSLSIYSKELKQNTLYKVRLLLDSQGDFSLSHQVIKEKKPQLRIKLFNKPIDSNLPFQYKTTYHQTRGFYDTLHEKYVDSNEFDELVFHNQENIITEGRYYNIFIEHQGELITSPVTQGLLPGIYREQLLQQQAKEKNITIEMLESADKIWLCNAIRGLIPAVYLGKVNDSSH